MKCWFVVTAYVFFLLCFTMPAQAQQSNASIISAAQHIAWLGKAKGSTSLFVHFDKNIYSNNENVWFTAYLIKARNEDDHHILSVALVRNDDRSVLADARFPCKSRVAFGNLFLPDSLPTGDYNFICYTNNLVQGYPTALFMQPVTIKSNGAKNFTANLSLKDSIHPGLDSTIVLLKAYEKDYTLVKAGQVKYFIGTRNHPLRSGILKTDRFGEASIPVPLSEVTAANNTLQVEVSNGTAIKNFSLKLPLQKQEVRIGFYPEGGHLINGVVNTVGWEATNMEGEAQPLSASLFRDDIFLQKMETNEFGMGKFKLKPEAGSRYFFKTASPGKDSIFMLPVAKNAGVSIAVDSALTSDTLFVKLYDMGEPKKILFLVHDYQSSYVNAAVVTTGRSMLVKIPLDDVPNGIATLTMLDSLGRPLAERLFFAHYDDRASVSITTDSSVYHSRQKVQVKFRITDKEKHPIAGLVSVACVQNNRIDMQKMMDIESYALIINSMKDFPFKKDILGIVPSNKVYLEQLLLIKGWRKYTWNDVVNSTAADTVVSKSSPVLKGNVLMGKKPLKKPVILNLKKYITPQVSELEFIYTDSLGKFLLPDDKIVTAPNNKIELSVRNDRQEFYNISVDEPYKTLNRKMAEALPLKDYSQRSFSQSSQSFVFKSDEVAKTLSTVTITAKKDDTFYGSGAFGPNACGDYVCSYNILNCTNHLNDGYQPVVGKTYNVRMGSSMSQIVYTGCYALQQKNQNNYLLAVQGIYSAKEFYVSDLSKMDAGDPQYLSTLYWNYAILTDENGEGSFQFSTGDITGKFRIVLQGISDHHLLYGEKLFEVKEW